MRIYLSPPWVDEAERAAIAAAFDSGYIAPCGPMVDRFEQELARLSGRRCAVAVASGTAAIDLVMEHLGVDASWTVVAPTLTFMATVGPARHRGARLAFVDSDSTGNVDTALLDAALGEIARDAPPERTLFTGVDLYGRCMDYDAVERICAAHGVKLLCDSAEAVGAKYGARPAGSAGFAGIYSFNGNKIITTSGGGALVTDSVELAGHARKLSQQSREPRPWYEHREVGFNYRMSNILAALGLAQAAKLPEILKRRARNKERYTTLLPAIGATLLPPVDGENNWLTVALAESENGRNRIMAALADFDIESRPVWKPMHMQPVFASCRAFGGAVAEDLFRRGVCLPSGSGLGDAEWLRIASALDPRRPAFSSTAHEC